MSNDKDKNKVRGVRSASKSELCDITSFGVILLNSLNNGFFLAQFAEKKNYF